MYFYKIAQERAMPEMARRQEKLQRQTPKQSAPSGQQKQAQQAAPAQPIQQQLTPSQMVRQALYEWMSMQQFKQQTTPIMQMRPAVGELMQQQRAQEYMQKEMLRQQIEQERKNMVLQNSMPRQTIQPSQQSSYVTPEQMEILNNIYNSVFVDNPMSSLPVNPMKDYQGFINPNMDAQNRPLGDETNSLVTI